MKTKQTTIEKEVTLRGIGLHTGKVVTMTFLPAPAHHGICFRRTDLEGAPLVKAVVGNVTDTSRGTTLEQNDAKVMTVEHLMAAASGLSIDNMLVDIDSEETPILDGSAMPYVQLLLEAGIVSLEAERQYIELREVITFNSEDRKTEFIAIPSDHFHVSVSPS